MPKRTNRLILLTIALTLGFGTVDFVWLFHSNVVLSSENYRELAKVSILLSLSYLVARVAIRRLSGNTAKIANGIRHAASSLQILIRFAALFIPLGFVCSIYMYLATAVDAPLRDAELAHFDAMVGFDWQAFLNFCNDRPWLAAILAAAYHSVGLQMCSLIVIFAAMRREDRLIEFAALLAVSSLMTAIGMVLVPAAGAHAYFSPSAETFSNFTGRAGMWHFEELLKLRSGEPFLFIATKSEGLVTFPSYHTALGLIITYAVRGSLLAFCASCLINGLMIVATLPEGGHYLIDVAAGALVGSLSIVLVRLYAQRMSRYASAPAALPSLRY